MRTNSTLNIKKEAKRLADLGYSRESFVYDGLPSDLKSNYTFEEASLISEYLPEFIPNMEILAEFINDMDDYDNKFVEDYCKKSNWELGDDEWHICHNDTHQLIFNDKCEAIVIEL